MSACEVGHIDRRAQRRGRLGKVRPTTPTGSAALRISLAGALLLLLTACGGIPEAGDDGKDAAEPADAPPTAVEPDGEVTEVAPRPEGIVYSAAEDALVVGARDPERLLILDPDSLAVREEVRLPGKLRHLQTSQEGSTALVPIETANTLFEVEIASGEVRETLVERYPHDATGTDDGDVWVGNEFAGTISVIRDGEIVETLDDVRQPGGVLAEGDLGVSVDVREYSVTTYDLDRIEKLEQAPAGEGPTHGRLIGGGRLAVSDTRGDQVLLYTLDPLVQVAAIDVPGTPYGLAADRRSQTLWVTLTARNELVGFDVSGDRPREIERYATVRQPNTVATTPGARSIWVTGTADGQIQRIDR